MTLIQFLPPADNERGPKYLESLLEGWVSLSGKQGIRLGITSDKGQLGFLLDIPGQRQRIIAAQLENAYPGGKAIICPPRPNVPSKREYYSWLRLSPDVFPLKLHHEFVEGHSREAVDPLEGLYEFVKSGRSGRAVTTVWFELVPTRKKQTHKANKHASKLAAEFPLRTLKKSYERNFSGTRVSQRLKTRLLFKMIRTSTDLSESIEAKLSQHVFGATIKIETVTETNDAALHNQHVEGIRSLLSLLTGFSAFFFVEDKPCGSFLLTSPEMATLWHIPTVQSSVPRVRRAIFKELEPPPLLEQSESLRDKVTLGRVCFRNERFRFAMDMDTRRRHLWILGKTGMGKTTLLQSIIAQDMDAGRGLALLEPHGDLALQMRMSVPKHRKNDLVYFDPADLTNPVTFNPLAVPSGGDKTLVADGVLSAFKKVFGLDEESAPRLLHIFRNSLLSLVEMPGATLLDVQRLLVEPVYRKSVISRVKNPIVRSFWLDEFGKWKPHDRTAFVASLQNKLGAFLTNEKLQRVLGDPRAKLDLRRIMDDGKLLVVNLSKGRLGEDASNLLGTLVVTSLQLAAMSRANVPEADRRDFSIVMDEFQNMATPSIATFLSEARKYRTHLILANQFTEQIPAEILAAVRGNVGSQILFQIDYADAELLSAGSNLEPEHLLTLPSFHAYCRLLAAGSAGRFWSMQTIKPKN